MQIKQIDRLFHLVLVLLILIAGFGIYHLIYIADDWLERVLVFFGYGMFVMMGFMAAVFGFAGMANSADMQVRKQENEQQKNAEEPK